MFKISSTMQPSLILPISF